MMVSNGFLVVVALLQVTVLVYGSSSKDGSESNQLSPQKCSELGFKSDELQCSRCRDLSKFDLEELKDSCLKCCRTDGDREEIKRFAKARLEMCRCKLGRYPQINEFLKQEKSKKFKNFSFKHIPGMDPIIKLMNAQGAVLEEMSIEKWDTDTIEEFLKEHLEG